MPWYTDEVLKDIELTITKPHAKHIKIVAHLGDLYLGEKLFLGGSVKAATQTVLSYLKYNGSLH